MNANFVTVKKLLKKENPPFPFGGKYRFSPYMACAHRCIYCDGRYEKYHVEGDFNSDIVIRENAPELLEKELSKLREPGPICLSSGISDAYQPIEKSLSITRQCAEVLSKYNHPVIIHTKSSLVLRDIEYWEKVHNKSAFTLMISLTMTSDRSRSLLEPGASTVLSRLNAVKQFRSRGMNAGVLAMPFIPFITDTTEQLNEFLKLIKAYDTQFAMPGLLTLKKGRQKEYFLKAFKNAYSSDSVRLEKLYSNDDYYGNPSSEYLKSFYSKVENLWKVNEVDDLIPHIVYKGQFAFYDEIAILLKDMITLYRRKGTNVSRLKSASFKYSEWLSERRSYYARRRNLDYRQFEEEVKKQITSGAIEEVLGNKKLGIFLNEVLLGSVFNYSKLNFE